MRYENRSCDRFLGNIRVEDGRPQQRLMKLYTSRKSQSRNYVLKSKIYEKLDKIKMKIKALLYTMESKKIKIIMG